MFYSLIVYSPYDAIILAMCTSTGNLCLIKGHPQTHRYTIVVIFEEFQGDSQFQSGKTTYNFCRRLQQVARSYPEITTCVDCLLKSPIKNDTMKVDIEILVN